MPPGLATKAALETAVTMLFAPGDSARKLERALDAGAHAVIADLEDAVMPADRALARETVARVLAGRNPGGSVRVVRISCPDGRPHPEDLAAVATARADAIMLPKASLEALEHVVPADLPVVALVESARGLREAYEIARHPAVVRLALGTVDLVAELGLSGGEDPLPLLFARSQLVRDCAAAEAAPPLDGVRTDVRDLDALRRADRHARALGMRGRLCVHPAQLPVVAEDFRPTAAERAWAERVVAAYRDAGATGALSLDGEMIDEAVAKGAERLLGDARR